MGNELLGMKEPPFEVELIIDDSQNGEETSIKLVWLADFKMRFSKRNKEIEMNLTVVEPALLEYLFHYNGSERYQIKAQMPFRYSGAQGVQLEWVDLGKFNIMEFSVATTANGDPALWNLKFSTK